RRSGHATEGGQDRYRDPAPVPQLPHVELAADLQRDDEEEERHQAVVDPVTQAVGQLRVGEPDRQVGGPELFVGPAPRRVRPQQGRERRDQQDQGAAHLGRREDPHRSGQVPHPGGTAGGQAIRRCGHATILPAAPALGHPTAAGAAPVGSSRWSPAGVMSAGAARCRADRSQPDPPPPTGARAYLRPPRWLSPPRSGGLVRVVLTQPWTSAGQLATAWYPAAWSRNSRAYVPPAAIRVSWVPCSTTVPSSSTTSTSASRTVFSRWEMSRLVCPARYRRVWACSWASASGSRPALGSSRIIRSRPARK